MHFATTCLEEGHEALRDPAGLRPSVDAESMSVVVVESPEVVSSCLSRLRSCATGASANWLYCRGRDERFVRFAERALRHVRSWRSHTITTITYFAGSEEAIECERAKLLSAYLRALPADGTLSLVAPEEQQRAVLWALAVLQGDNPRKARVDVAFFSRLKFSAVGS
jgi:hypothetical protein